MALNSAWKNAAHALNTANKNWLQTSIDEIQANETRAVLTLHFVTSDVYNRKRF